MKVECENLSEREATPELVTRYRYYLRITQKMKGDRRFSWSYRMPLK